MRKAILTFIGDLANWDNSANDAYLSVARALVKAAHPEETPLVVDPFAGGGSIPLEALRLGCEAFASDLNPVACLILKVMLEDIPRHGPELAEELRRVGKEIKEKAQKELAKFYPKDPDGATPIAYLWARTVRCESPNCGAEIPLMRSFWLCKKASRKRALRYTVHHKGTKNAGIVFEIFEPQTDKEVAGGTVARAKATCLCCGNVLPPERVRAQLSKQRGGADAVFDSKGSRIGGARMLAVVTIQPGIQGRNYRLPTDRDYKSTWKAQKRLQAILDEWEQHGKKGLSPMPDELRPPSSADRVSPYGMTLFSDLTSCRQKLSLIWLVERVKNITDETLRRLFAIVVGRCVDYWSSGTQWVSGGEFVAHTFVLQVIPIGWDFPEVAVLSDGSGNFDGAVDWVARVAERTPKGMIAGQVQLADARTTPLPEQSASIWFTDPPYYDAVRYSDLSDSFFVWIKRATSANEIFKDPFNVDNPLTPKDAEIVQDELKQFLGKPKDQSFFETAMAQVFVSGRHLLRDDGIGSVVFAHKTTEGWEALLTGMIQGGWTITSSWPIATERPGRMRSLDSAALATSVHLVCRPRPGDASVGDWGDVLRELPKRVGDWMERLQDEGIRGADLVFACIGPALEIYSRYSKVVDPQEREIPIGGDPEADEPHKRGFLAFVWETVGRLALQNILGTEEARARNGMAGVLEEDARLTALFLWTLQSSNGEGKSKKTKGKSEDVEEEPEEEEIEDDEEDAPKGKTKGYSLVFDVVRRFAQPLGIDLPKWEGRVIEIKKGVVRLLSVSERSMRLFGTAGMETAVEELLAPAPSGQMLLPGLEELASQKRQRPKGRGKKVIIDDPGEIDAAATTLDRVHAAMLLQAGGQAHALRSLLKAEQERGQDFLRLANALSALYPTASEEKRLLDAMLLAVPR